MKQKFTYFGHDDNCQLRGNLKVGKPENTEEIPIYRQTEATAQDMKYEKMPHLYFWFNNEIKVTFKRARPAYWYLSKFI